MEKVTNKLEIEQENLQKLKESLENEKQNNRRTQELLEREQSKTESIQSQLDTLRAQYNKEIRELHDKLDHAGKVISTLQVNHDEPPSNILSINTTTKGPKNQNGKKPAGLGDLALSLFPPKSTKPNRQPVDEYINASEAGPLYESSPDWNFPEKDEAPGEEAAAKSSLMNLFASSQLQGDDAPGNISQDLSKIRELESEKQGLQKRLGDARNALDDYTTKLDSQLKAIETKASGSDRLVKKLSNQNAGLASTVHSLEEQRMKSARQNWNLLNQKLQLQRLIERLTRLQE